MNCTRSKTGLPVIIENGGGCTNTGFAQIICGYHGEKIKPLFIPKGYSNGEHALFVAKENFYVINAGHSRDGDYIKVYIIRKIGTSENPDEIVLELLYEYENGDGNIPDYLQNAANSALNKSKDYHCRSPYFVKI